MYMGQKLAVIDLGTNTFQLIVAEQRDQGFGVIHQKSTPSRIGKGGINQGMITGEAIERAVAVLTDFKNELAPHGLEPQHIFLLGTSAIRNAENKDFFIKTIEDSLDLSVRVIDGDTEAHLIYLGVKQAVPLETTPHLIMDIGGGSVEFIIADQETVYWKKSFEIGGQRLIEKFVKSDPVSSISRKQINNFLDQNLIPLTNAIHQYAPQVLVGSSGTFETLADMHHWSRFNDWPPTAQNGFELPLEEFYRSRNLILGSTREERMKIPGMKELRVDMISVAICVIDYILGAYGMKRIKVSRYSLKEGVLYELVRNPPDLSLLFSR